MDNQKPASLAENKALLQRYMEAGWNKGDMRVIEEICDPAFNGHDLPPGLPTGVEGEKLYIAALRAAFPDFNYTIDDLVAEGEKVVDRGTMRGTHQGEFMGIAPTGKTVAISGIFINRFANGKLVERWSVGDTLGLLQQLGAIPMAG